MITFCFFQEQSQNCLPKNIGQMEIKAIKDIQAVYTASLEKGGRDCA
jgi:hypothetical protein